jgi:hypothetical protein
MEISPPAYYAFMHEWLYRFGWSHEWVARLPSAACGALLVGAVYWLCAQLQARRVTRLAAAALTALSPFVLEEAQLAEPYVFAALAVTVAVAAAVRAGRDTPAAPGWLAVSLAASLLALSLHYTAVLAIAPLCVFVVARSSTPRRWRIAFPLACALAEVALLPLLISQHNAFPTRPGTAVSGAVSWTSITNMLELPFAGRVLTLKALGVAVTAIGLAAGGWWAWRGGGARRLVLAIAVGEPLCLLVLSLLGGGHFWGHLMLTRYAAVAAPLLIVSFALALEAVPLTLAGALAGCAAAVAIAGALQSHRRAGFYLDARGAVAYVQRHIEPGDRVLATSDTVAQVPLLYYGIERLHPRWIAGGRFLSELGGRSWVITELPAGSVPSAAATLAYERRVLGLLGRRPLAARTFAGIPGLLVVLIARG